MEQKENRTLTIAVVTGLVALLLGTCLGAIMGGAGGYLIGRQAAERTAASNVGVPTPRRFAVPIPSPLVPGPSATPRPRQVRPPLTLVPQPPQATPRSSLSLGTGALISEVTSGSPAGAAGLQPGDVITRVDDQDLDATHSLSDIVASHKPGDRLRLTVLRNADTRTLTVELGARADDSQRAYLGVRFTEGVPVPIGPRPTP